MDRPNVASARLPLLPGYSFKDLTKQNFHKSQTLKYQNGQAVSENLELPKWFSAVDLNDGDVTDARLNEMTFGEKKSHVDVDTFTPPPYVLWDKKVLKFDAYFKENIENSQYGGYHIRKVNIYYHLEDDTISVYEPKVENSGLIQGKTLRRQKIQKNGLHNFWHWKDFNVAIDFSVYGQNYHIYDCDEWTTKFLVRQGIQLNPRESLPDDPYVKKRDEQKLGLQPTFKTPAAEDKLWKYLNLDRKVLRFYGSWKNGGSTTEDALPIILHYYLVDDTIDIREVHKPNDGRDPYPLLFRRQKVPKHRKTDFLQSSSGAEDPSIWYSPKDFIIGSQVDIYGRKVLICDSDDFTKEYYQRTFGIGGYAPITSKPKKETTIKKEPPPYLGFGSPEDSMQSCLSLTPKPPKKNIIKFLENTSKVLRFEAVFDSATDIDKTRKFILCYHLADDTVTIYEPPIPNSGILGGKFLERGRIQKPGSDKSKPAYYEYSDFYVGAVIKAVGRTFRVTNADQYALQFIRENAPMYRDHALEGTKPKTSQEVQTNE